MYRNIWISLLQAYAAGHAGRGAALQMYRYLLVFAAEIRTQNLRRAGLSSLVSARARPPCSGIRYKCRERGRATSSGLVRNSPIASRLQAVLVSWEAGHRICDLVGLFSRVSSSAKHGPAQHQGGAAFFLLGSATSPPATIASRSLFEALGRQAQLDFRYICTGGSSHHSDGRALEQDEQGT